MKKTAWAYALLCSLTLFCLTGATLVTDSGIPFNEPVRPIQIFAPVAVSEHVSTKSQIAVSTGSYKAVRVKPSAAVSVFINTTSSTTGYPLAQDTEYTFAIRPEVTRLVFTHASSGGTYVRALWQ